MPDNHEPTLGEILRRLDAAEAARVADSAQTQRLLSGLSDDIRAERQHVAATYVRVDNNDRDLREIRDDVTELKGNWKTQQDRNRQIIIGVIIGFLVMVCGVIANAVGFTTGGA